jgi:hypothetical protein
MPSSGAVVVAIFICSDISIPFAGSGLQDQHHKKTDGGQ